MRSGRIITFTSPRASVAPCCARSVRSPTRTVQAAPSGPSASAPIRFENTQEVGDEDRVGLFVDRLGRVRLLDAPLVHHRDPVAHRERLALVVRHEDERDPELGLERLELDLEILTELGVQRAQRLVEQQHAGLQHKRPRERDALLLSA